MNSPGAWRRHTIGRPQDKGTQADDGPTINPLRYVKSAHNTSLPFTFVAPNCRINWKGLRAVDPQQMLQENATASVMQLFETVAYGDLEQGSIYERSEANLMKLLQLAQLQLQYLQFKLEEKLEADQVFEDDALALAAGLSSLQPPSLSDMDSQLGGIRAALSQLGNSRVEGLIEQVRAEERSAAKAVLSQAIQTTKQQMEATYAHHAVQVTGNSGDGIYTIPAGLPTPAGIQG